MNDISATVAIQRFPVYSLRFWMAYGVQMRPYLLFVSGIAGLSGIAWGVTPETKIWEWLAIFFPLFLGYGFGQAFTDCFQTDTDKLSSPYRPLSKGTLSIPAVLVISSLGLVGIAVVLYLFNPVSFWLCMIAVLGTASYSYVKKHFWYGGPVHNAWIVALLPLMGYFAISGKALSEFPNHLLVNVGITYFSYASFVLIGYLKDIEADRVTEYKTFPVVFGWDKTVWLGDFIALVTLVLFWSRPLLHMGELIFGVTGTLVLIFGEITGHFSGTHDEKGALWPILATVRSFILLHIGLVLHYQPHWAWLMIVFYLLFELVLWRRPSRYQV